ncbi:MAG: hypothetical protein H7Y18_06220 [Clostridiaceae bacterium]|nr:hypothetical protein [Clostridiaceae bacterium]
MGRRIESWIEQGVTDIKNGIKDWYKNGGKYLIKIVKVVAFAALVVAITILTLGTGVALFFAILSLVLLAINTGSSVYYNIKAYQNGDNRIEAERLSEKSGFEMVTATGKGLDWLFNTNYFEKSFCTVFVVASVMDFGYGIFKLGTSFKTEFKNIKLAMKYGNRNGSFVTGAKHLLKKSYTSVNAKFTRDNTTKILKPIQKILKTRTQNYYPVRKVINNVLKPYKYYVQVIDNYTLVPKYNKGKKIAKRVVDAINGDFNINSSSMPKINIHPRMNIPNYNNIR